jgi:hypothetical protein
MVGKGSGSVYGTRRRGIAPTSRTLFCFHPNSIIRACNKVDVFGGRPQSSGSFCTHGYVIDAAAAGIFLARVRRATGQERVQPCLRVLDQTDTNRRVCLLRNGKHTFRLQMRRAELFWGPRGACKMGIMTGAAKRDGCVGYQMSG